MSLQAALSLIDHKYLQTICDQETPETPTLDFKRSLPERGDKGRAEFLKDVCALANGSGGDLVFGILEKDGNANAIEAITESTPDETVLRLGQILDSSIEPKISGVRFHTAKLTDGFCLVVRVPASFLSPHRYIFNNHTRFVIREFTHVRDMTYLELRNAFLQLGDARRAAATRRDIAVGKLYTQATALRLPKGPTCLVQVLPLSTGSGAQTVDLMKLDENCVTLMLPDWGGCSRLFNLDGLLVYSGRREEEQYSYVQAYRDGSVEAYSHAGHFAHEKLVPSVTLTTFIRVALERILLLYRKIGVSGPAVVYVSLADVPDHRLGIGNSGILSRLPISDRSDLLLPEFLIENVENLQDIDSLTRPIFDIMWQAFGLAQCGFFNEKGEWSPPK